MIADNDDEPTAGGRPEYDDDYATCDECRASLLIYADETSPEEITLLPGRKPTNWVAKGRPMPRNKSGQLGRINGWFLELEGAVKSRDLRRHVDYLLDQIAPFADRLKQLLLRPGVRAELRCVWWSKHGQGGPNLWPRQLRWMGGLNLELGFDLAFYGEQTNPFD